MEDDVTTEPGSTDAGQSDLGSEGTQTTQAAPGGGEGQSVAQGTTGSGPQEDTFFDPKSVPDELLPAYKQMQGSFTKRMQDIARHRDKVEAYDAFMSNPVEQLRKMAQQYGFQVSPAGQQQEQRQQEINPDWQPQNWDEVIQKAASAGEKRAEERIMQRLQPVLSQFQQMKATAVEEQLDGIDPTWRDYEDQMKANLESYPQLAMDPAKLYKVSVPDDVIMSRATQAALKRMEAKTRAGGTSGGSTTTRQPADDLSGQGPRSFADSVEAARRSLAQQGLTPPK